MIWRINRKLSKGEDTLGRQLMLKVRFKPASIKPTEHDRLRILSQFERVRMLCVLNGFIVYRSKQNVTIRVRRAGKGERMKLNYFLE